MSRNFLFLCPKNRAWEGEESVFSPRRAGISTKRSKHLLRKTVVFFKNE
ncbi:hypothetical protein M086_4387 [Bacteroides fragilis str. S13 L11]|nr:hypothetical protein M086_4387 [Bacteroides fragilis str. S13 L11]EXZ67708.1 hypothetical protein M120_2763 [Bacteroides fragilis str. 3783N1-8]